MDGAQDARERARRLGRRPARPPLPRVQSVRDEAAAVGVVTDALLAYVDPKRRGCWPRGDVPSVSGVIGWAVTDRAPNAEPWAHVDVEKLRAGLERGWR